MKRIITGIEWILIATACWLFGLMFYELAQDYYHPWECVEKHKVAKILALRYRAGVIELDNGMQMTVDQATLQPGDFICTRREQKQ